MRRNFHGLAFRFKAIDKVALEIFAVWTGLVARLPALPRSTFGAETLESSVLAVRYRNHEHDPTGHVPGIHLAFQGVLDFQFGSASVDGSVEPIQCLLPLVGARDRELKQLGFERAA